ncbi:hypothetical protein ACWEAF_42165, partial [Streptomyces sp. NPDC005071]
PRGAARGRADSRRLPEGQVHEVGSGHHACEWGPVATGPHTADVWVAASLNQCDGDAPMIIVALVSDRPIIELEDEQPTAFRLGRE